MQHSIIALRRALLLIAVTAAALAGAGNTLDIYFIDTEGGQATLPAHYLKVSATEDGAFTVFNSRTNETKRYAARR